MTETPINLAGLRAHTRSTGAFVIQELSGARRAMSDTLGMADHLASGLDRNLRRAFEQLAVQGASFKDVLKDMALSMARIGLSAAIAPVTRGLSGLITGAISAVAAPSGIGAVAAPSGIGGALGKLTQSPATFDLAKTGPAAPRGEGSKLVVNIATPDVAGFRRAEGQVAASLARMVDRGRRHA